MASKIDVKDKIDGDTMDLSFLELTDVPLRDMVSFRKVRSIDLSTNKLVRLPANFVSLTHLVKLDLSKNQLRELPENFGQLRKLRHLDLFSNQLQQLPLSFCELTELKFLDLKDNPLVPILKDTAGDCIDAKACQLAAKKVVAMMGVLKAGVEKELKKEKEKREREERAQREIEAAAIEQARKEKRAAKEIRRNDAQNRKPEKRRENGHQEIVDDSGFEEPRQYYERPVPVKPTHETGNAFVGFISGMLLTVALTLLVCFLGVFLARWSGPVTVDNVSRNLHGSYQASRDLLINAARQSSVVGTDLYDRARKFTQSKNLDQIIGQARNIWGSVASTMYEFLGAGYHAGVKGFSIMWKQGSEAFTWTAQEFPKWKSEILKKFN